MQDSVFFRTGSLWFSVGNDKHLPENERAEQREFDLHGLAVPAVAVIKERPFARSVSARSDFPR